MIKLLPIAVELGTSSLSCFAFCGISSTPAILRPIVRVVNILLQECTKTSVKSVNPIQYLGKQSRLIICLIDSIILLSAYCINHAEFIQDCSSLHCLSNFSATTSLVAALDRGFDSFSSHAYTQTSPFSHAVDAHAPLTSAPYSVRSREQQRLEDIVLASAERMLDNEDDGAYLSPAAAALSDSSSVHEVNDDDALEDHQRRVDRQREQKADPSANTFQSQVSRGFSPSYNVLCYF